MGVQGNRVQLNAGYRFIVGDEVPDHTVIARFRQRHVGQMKGRSLRGSVSGMWAR